MFGLARVVHESIQVQKAQALNASCFVLIEKEFQRIPWIDKVALEIMIQKHIAKTANNDPCFKQLEVATETAVKDRYDGKRKSMNRFPELLETRKAEVNAKTAHPIFAIVVKIAP